MNKLITLLLAVILVLSNQAYLSANVSDLPRYVDSDKFGTYIIRTNKIYQIKTDGEKLVLDLGDGTTAINTATKQKINDWRSFYVTDVSCGYFSEWERYEVMLICGLVFIPDTANKNQGMPADVTLLYYPYTGELETMHINIGYPIKVSEAQYKMRHGSWFEYLESGIVWPRGVISKDGSIDLFVINNAVNLDIFPSKNKAKLQSEGYNGAYWELVMITWEKRIYSLFYGPQDAFWKRNPDFKTPEFTNNTHIVDPRLIVFKHDGGGEFVIASIGTDDSNICTAVNINTITLKEDYYWIDRSEFMQLINNQKPNDTPWGNVWSERYMD